MYVPLFCKSSFSFLEGASQPEELIETASRLGLKAIALTDRDGVYGIVRAHVGRRKPASSCSSARRSRSKTARRGVARDRPRGLRQPLSADHPRAAPLGKGRRVVGWREICERAPVSSRCGAGSAASLHDRARPGFIGHGCAKRSAIGSTRWSRATAAPTSRAEARLRLRAGRSRCRSSPRPRCSITARAAAAAGRAHLHPPRRHARGPPGGCSSRNDEHALKTPTRSRRLFADDPAAVARTLEIAARCTFSLDRAALPLSVGAPARRARPPRSGCASSPSTGARERYARRRARPTVVDAARQGARADRRARLLRLLPDDVGDRPFCREHGHPLPGARLRRQLRGLLLPGHHRRRSGARWTCCSSASSRRERAEPPDIDLDIEHERREEVIQHVYAKYGRDARRDGRERDPLPRALGGARRGQGARHSGDRRSTALAKHLLDVRRRSSPTALRAGRARPARRRRIEHLRRALPTRSRTSRATSRSTPAASCSGTSRCTTSSRSRTPRWPAAP